MVKLVKENKVVKFPSARGSVERVLKRVVQSCAQQEFSKIIIVTEGNNGFCVYHSKMHDYHVVGLLERAKHICVEEVGNG